MSQPQMSERKRLRKENVSLAKRCFALEKRIEECYIPRDNEIERQRQEIASLNKRLKCYDENEMLRAEVDRLKQLTKDQDEHIVNICAADVLRIVRQTSADL